MNKRDIIAQAIELHPEAAVFLGDAAFSAIKTEEGYFRQLWNRIRELYRSEISTGQFLDSLANLVQDQITRAWRQALRDEELDPNLVQTEYKDEAEAMILSEYDHVDGLAADIAQARESDAGFESFRVRAEMWARRYTDAYNNAVLQINEQSGGKLAWELGATEEHCETCAALNGVVAYAKEWTQAGVRPQNPPNERLDCGGWQCDCKLVSTTSRRTKNALDKIRSIIRNGG